jgi:hypothetical protein
MMVIIVLHFGQLWISGIPTDRWVFSNGFRQRYRGLVLTACGLAGSFDFLDLSNLPVSAFSFALHGTIPTDISPVPFHLRVNGDPQKMQ